MNEQQYRALWEKLWDMKTRDKVPYMYGDDSSGHANVNSLNFTCQR